MKIALVVTLGGDLVRSTEHLGIAYIAAVLRAEKYYVKIYEINEKQIDNIENYEELIQSKYDIVGFTTTCITMKDVNRLATKVKKYSSSSYVVYGGHTATFTKKKLFEYAPCLDISIIGEGEYTFLELVKCIETEGDLGSVKGIIYKKNGQIYENEERELIADLDKLPYPARDEFEAHGGQYIRLSTSRGCLGSCGFCSNFVGRRQKGKHWRGRSPKNVVDEIEMLENKYHFHTYDFVDSTFEDPGKLGKQRIKEIAKQIIERKLHIFYNCCFRAENWKDEDYELLDLLVQSGLEKINIGFESGNNRGLRILNKRATIEDNYKAISVIKQFPQVYLTFGFIMLHPYSTKEDLYDNATFLHNTGFGQVIRHYFWRLEVYPDTLLEKKLIEDKLLDKEYDINDGMYMYHFVNEEMVLFENVFSEMLKLKSVWDYEIFDILIHTFIVRLQKKYQMDSIKQSIDKFANCVNELRKKMQDYNYEFFLDLWNNIENYDLQTKKKELNEYILNNMKQVENLQYRLGKFMVSKGYDINIK